MIYGIDFDGTIVEEKFPAIGKPIEKTISFIRELQAKGHKWILITMREGKHLDDAVEWLKEQGLNPDAVNDNLPERVAKWGNNPRKVYADIYIDDHNAGGVYLPGNLIGNTNRDWLQRLTNSQLSKFLASLAHCGVCFPGNPKGDRKYWYDWTFKEYEKDED